MPHVKTGRLRALGVTSLGPSKLFPELPPVAESGLPGFQSVVIFGLYVPGRDASASSTALNQAWRKFWARRKSGEKFQTSARNRRNRPADSPRRSKPKWRGSRRVIKNAGIRED